MLLTLSTTHQPATDLGFLLHKHPERVFTFSLPLGQAHVFYPEAGAERCTVALLVELDPVLLSRGKGNRATPLEPYVNDRPYAASSYLSSALREAFGTAMTGRSKERPELALAALPFEVRLPALPSRGEPGWVQRLFEPLGYDVEATTHPLDAEFPEWGESPYQSVTLRQTVTLRLLLAHLYVLLPVLDDNQHYYVSEAEIDKLLRHGEGWLETHPERDLISYRFLKHRRALQKLANERWDGPEEEYVAPTSPLKVPLNEERLEAVKTELLRSGAARVLDLGCGEGNLLAKLLPERQFTHILGMDVSLRELARAHEKLRLDDLPERDRARLTLTQGSLNYRDTRLRGYDAAALVEVIEHLDAGRLWTLERVVFGDARPGTVIVTTPNQEYNAHWERLPAGETRHTDHRFEWTRAEFAAWATRVAQEFGYSVRFQEVGDADGELGAPTQMAIFEATATPLSCQQTVENQPAPSPPASPLQEGEA